MQGLEVFALRADNLAFRKFSEDTSVHVVGIRIKVGHEYFFSNLKSVFILFRLIHNRHKTIKRNGPSKRIQITVRGTVSPESAQFRKS